MRRLRPAVPGPDGVLQGVLAAHPPRERQQRGFRTVHEPNATALLLGTAGLLLAVSALPSPVARRTGLPVAFLFLGLGMLAGSDGIGHIAFEDYPFAFRLGTLAPWR